jgi:hypothetical protein
VRHDCAEDQAGQLIHFPLTIAVAIFHEGKINFAGLFKRLSSRYNIGMQKVVTMPLDSGKPTVLS